MFTFEASNVTNCKEREISFPLLILSLESKKRHGCETHVASFFISSLISYLLSLITFHFLSKVGIDLDEGCDGKGNGAEEHDQYEEGVVA